MPLLGLKVLRTRESDVPALAISETVRGLTLISVVPGSNGLQNDIEFLRPGRRLIRDALPALPESARKGSRGGTGPPP